MSRGTHYYIEVRIKDKWELLQCFTEEHLYCGFGKFNESDLEIDGRRFFMMDSDYVQGFVRDELDNDGDAPFTDRGFPVDMSEALRHRIANLEYAWGKSWCLLSEFSSYAQKKIDELLNELIEANRSIEFKKLENKMDFLIKSVTKESIPNQTETEEDNEYEENVNWLKEELDNYIYLSGFVMSIKEIASFITDDWCNEKDVRLVFYTC